MGRIRCIVLIASLPLALLAMAEPALSRGSKRSGEVLRSHGATLHVARGHYVDVASERSLEHAREEVEWADRTIEGWLRRFAEAEIRYEKTYKELRRARDPEAESYNVRILDPKIGKTVRDSLRRRRKHVIPKIRRAGKVLAELHSDAPRIMKVMGNVWGTCYYAEWRTRSVLSSSELFTRYVLGHELFHWFLRRYTADALTKKVPNEESHWVVEGMCDFLGSEAAGLKWAVDLSSSKASIRNKRMDALQTILVQYTRSAPPSPHGRLNVTSLLVYLREAGEKRREIAFYRLLAAMTGNVKGMPPDVRLPEFMRIIGVDEEGLKDFEKDFHEWVMKHWYANREEMERLRDEFSSGVPGK